MPKETIGIVLFMGVAFGLFWGSLSLVLWSANERIPALVIAPLWLTAELGSRLPIHPYLAGALACAVVGLLPAAIFLALARSRGW
jgi:hypothetical protein